MTTRREFLSRGFGILAGAAALGSATAAPVLANHRHGDQQVARTRDTERDGSCDGTPDGHPQNRGETNARTEGTEVRGGNAPALGATMGGRREPHDSARPGMPHGDGDGRCDGTRICDGSGPDR